MIMTKEAADILLKSIEADAKTKIKAVGGHCYTRIGNDEQGKVLMIQLTCITENQTKITDFSED